MFKCFNKYYSQMNKALQLSESSSALMLVVLVPIMVVIHCTWMLIAVVTVPCIYMLVRVVVSPLIWLCIKVAPRIWLCVVHTLLPRIWLCVVLTVFSRILKLVVVDAIPGLSCLDSFQYISFSMLLWVIIILLLQLQSG